MQKKVKINILVDKYKNFFFNISIYNKYKYKQYILQNNILYTFFLIIQFLYKFSLIKIRIKK